MDRLVRATQNSARAFAYLARSEAAFRQELAVLVVAVPSGWFVANTWRGYALLIGAVLLVILIEVINTAIEAACDAVSPEFREEIRIAKDCGSLAVAIGILIAGMVWLLAIAEWLSGTHMPA